MKDVGPLDIYPRQSSITKSTSEFLDLLRVSAAVVVLVYHCAHFWNPEISSKLENPAHASVIIFFVMSGYVIAASSLSKTRNSARYAIARISRLYSVIIPALLVSLALLWTGNVLFPVLYGGISRGHDLLRFIVSGFFLQNLWFLSSSPPTNAPFWSLSYEFWYYLIFGTVIFPRRPIMKILLSSLACLVAGPSILLLMPCWLFGVALHFLAGTGARVGKMISLTGLFLGIAIVYFVVNFGQGIPFIQGRPPLFYSAAFISDWLAAFGVAVAIFSFQALNLHPWRDSITNIIGFFSNNSFSIYLFHYPIIIFITGFLQGRILAPCMIVLLAASVLLFICVFGRSVENSKRIYSKFLTRVFIRDTSSKTPSHD